MGTAAGRQRLREEEHLNPHLSASQAADGENSSTQHQRCPRAPVNEAKNTLQVYSCKYHEDHLELSLSI